MLLGNGDGNLRRAACRYTGVLQPSSVTVGDVTGDGRPDAVVTSYYSATVSVFAGHRRRSARRPDRVRRRCQGPRRRGSPTSTATRKLDVVVSNEGAGSLSVLLHSATTTGLTAATKYASGTPTRSRSGDFNGDGKRDLAASKLRLERGCGAHRLRHRDIRHADVLPGRHRRDRHRDRALRRGRRLADIVTANYHGGQSSVLSAARSGRRRRRPRRRPRRPAS